MSEQCHLSEISVWRVSVYLSEGIYWLVLNEVIHEMFPAASEITPKLWHFTSKLNFPSYYCCHDWIYQKYALVTYADNFNVLYYSHCIHNWPLTWEMSTGNSFKFCRPAHWWHDSMVHCYPCLEFLRFCLLLGQFNGV